MDEFELTEASAGPTTRVQLSPKWDACEPLEAPVPFGAGEERTETKGLKDAHPIRP